MNLNCFSCNVFLGKGRNVINIFDDECPLQSRRKICEVISEIVDRQITECAAHSKVLCKKCFGTISEYDSLNIRLKVLKSEYTQQLLKILPHYQQHYVTSKSVVVPASKLQPIPSNYLIDMSKVPVSKPTITISNVAYKGVLPELFKTITTTPKSSVNLKVTVGSTVLTQNLNSSITCQPKLLVSSTNTLTSSKIADTSISDKITTTITQSQTKNPVMSYNLGSITKDFLVQNAGLIKIETDGECENIDEQAMEIDEDCTLAVGVASDDQDKNEYETSPNKKTNFDLGMLLSQEGITRDDKDGKYIIDRLRIIDQNDEDDDDGEEVLVDEDGNRTSIIRVAAGQQVLYGGRQIALLQPRHGRDSLDSNDEAQIELQVSGDEETANAIIAAAQERGGAFIKVESGEMYRVQSIESKPDDETDSPHFQNIVERDGDLYKCLLCENNENREPGSGVGDAETVMAHLRSAHAARAYICPACGLVMRKRSDYSKHLAEHASKGKTLLNKSKLHECTFCKKKYNSRTLLNEHLNVHAGTRPYACGSCGKTFASKYTHQAHLKTHSLRPRPFKCEQCAKTFFTQQNLSQHAKTHSGLKEFVCNVCGKAYATQHNLEVHGVVHTGRKPFPCPMCAKPFARRAEVRDHMRIHTGERPFACDICGATFTQRSNLHSHKRATHLDDKRYPCLQCPKRFKRKRLLEYHIKAAHTGERPLQCEVCSATFVYPEHYKKHGRIHSGERPYTCEVCGKTFNSRDNRNMHRFVHSDKKPYECLTCGAGYMRKRLLYAHMNTTGHVAESIVVNQPRVIKTTGEGMAPLIDVNAIQMKADKFTEDNFQIFETEELESEENQISTVAVSEADHAKLYLVQEKKDSTVNLIQEGEEPTFLTLHNFNGLIEATDDKQVDEQIQVVTDENGDTVRLIQVQLPGGQMGWIALDH